MKFTPKQGRRIKNVCILVVIADVLFIIDKHNILGMAIAVPAALVMTYAYFHEEV